MSDKSGQSPDRVPSGDENHSCDGALSHPVIPSEDPAFLREKALSALSREHLEMLRKGSAISDEVIAARGYRTVTRTAEVSDLGFAPSQCVVPALVLPLHAPSGERPFSVLRPDYPRVFEKRDNGRLPDGTYPQKVLKYEVPKGVGMRLDCPPLCRPLLGDPATPLWITEGQKKADALASHGLCAIDLLGVWNFKGRNEFGGSTILPDFDSIAWKDRDVPLVFDSDVLTKRQVQQAMDHLVSILRSKGARVVAVYLPPKEDGSKQGVDDFFANGHTVEQLLQMVGAPRQRPKPAPPVVEFLAKAPEVMFRPMALIDGRAYAATTVPARITETETVGRGGEIVRLPEPQQRNGRLLLIVRDDGRRYTEDGSGADAKIADLGFEVNFPQAVHESRTWRYAAVQAYCAARRPSPIKLFRKLGEVVNRFIDFDLSLADQPTMCELISAWVMSTYFLPAFTVIGYLWANGDRGVGKSHLADLVCEVSYLGQGSSASLTVPVMRDLAGQGATVLVDEAERLADPHLADPDKRSLILAGNRRNSEVVIKEPAGERGWVTRWISTYCPRVFSAISLPDHVLASRCIIVPLVRTPERYRANADPLDHGLWPYEPRDLIDELWAVSLRHLPQMPAYESRVNELASLAGRDLEPWRPALAVALWLQDLASPGSRESDLFGRLERLSVAYQAERESLEPADTTRIALRALERLFDAAAPDVPVLKASATEVSKAMAALIQQDDCEITLGEVSPVRVGTLLGRLRFPRERQAGTGGRRWVVTRERLDRALLAYGLVDPSGGGSPSSTAPGEPIESADSAWSEAA